MYRGGWAYAPSVFMISVGEKVNSEGKRINILSNLVYIENIDGYKNFLEKNIYLLLKSKIFFFSHNFFIYSKCKVPKL